MSGAEPRSPSDESLVGRFQEGDSQAFAELVRRHQRALYNFAIRHLGTDEGADDIVQEAFVRVVRNAAEFKHESKFSTWVYTIVRNLCIDQLRKRKLRRHPSLDAPRPGRDGEGPSLGEAMPDSRANVERSATDSELRRRLASAVAELPEDQREVFVMRQVSGLPFKEIAEITGVPENTVKSRMRYALERLQGALSEFEEYARALK